MGIETDREKSKIMKSIYKSLAAFQQEVPVIHKATQGYGYSYSDLPTIFAVINPLLKKHGLGFTQLVGLGVIKTVIFHIESGETLETETEIPHDVKLAKMNDFQVLGSAITYIRRYALSSALGLVTDKDTDAAGEQKKPTVSDAIAEVDKVKNNDQINAVWSKYKQFHKTPEFREAVKVRSEYINAKNEA